MWLGQRAFRILKHHLFLLHILQPLKIIILGRQSPTLHLLVVSPGNPLSQERGAKKRGILPFRTPLIHAGSVGFVSLAPPPAPILRRTSTIVPEK